MDKPPPDFHEALAECYLPPNGIVQSMGRFFGANFPRYRDSNDTPPAIRNDQWVDVRPDFDGFLGEYRARPPLIITYKKAILSVATENDWHPWHLERLVLFHEWTHALHHLGMPKTTDALGAKSSKAAKTKAFTAASEHLKEQIAQLNTLLVLRSQAELDKSKKFYETLEDIFFSLMSRQSRKYQLPHGMREATIARLRDKVQVLFRISDCGSSLDQEEIAQVLE
jgi:hypothetical protein